MVSGLKPRMGHPMILTSTSASDEWCLTARSRELSVRNMATRSAYVRLCRRLCRDVTLDPTSAGSQEQTFKKAIERGGPGFPGPSAGGHLTHAVTMWLTSKLSASASKRGKPTRYLSQVWRSCGLSVSLTSRTSLRKSFNTQVSGKSATPCSSKNREQVASFYAFGSLRLVYHKSIRSNSFPGNLS